MNLHVLVLALALISWARAAEAAIPAARLSDKTDARVAAEVRAEQASPSLRAAPAPNAAAEAEAQVILQRALRERDNLWNARFDDIHSRLYEVVGRLQLLAACLVAVVLAMFVWMQSIARQVARLSAEVRAERSGGLR